MHTVLTIAQCNAQDITVMPEAFDLGDSAAWCITCQTLPTTTCTKARCYMEYCCNHADFEVEVLDRSPNHDQGAIPWGWCFQHKHHAWSQRTR